VNEDNKLRLKQLGWGNAEVGPAQRKLRNSIALRTKAEVRLLKVEKELNDVKRWLERLAERYKASGYDARPIEKQIENIKKALSP